MGDRLSDERGMLRELRARILDSRSVRRFSVSTLAMIDELLGRAPEPAAAEPNGDADAGEEVRDIVRALERLEPLTSSPETAVHQLVNEVCRLRAENEALRRDRNEDMQNAFDAGRAWVTSLVADRLRVSQATVRASADDFIKRQGKTAGRRS